MLLGKLPLSPPSAQQMEGLDVEVVVAAAPAAAVVAMAAGTATCLGEAVGDECEEVDRRLWAEAP